MMDRTVELAEVLQALKGEGGTSNGLKGGNAVLRDVAPRVAASPSVASPSVAAPSVGPLSLDRLRALWPDVVARAHAASPMIGTLLAETQVSGVDGSTVTLVSLGNVEGLEHKRDAIAKLVAEYVSGPVKVIIAAAGESATAKQPSGSRPARLTEETANAERLKVLRAKDPSLGAAVDALDLEIVE
jgi:hypothetical protein